MTVKYGIVGSGTMGLVYAEALATQVDDGELVAITGGSRAGSLAAEYGVPAAESLERMLADHRPDAVIVATPHTTHLPYTRLAADAGAHVYCEKPMAVTVDECDAMLAACADAGVLITVAAQSRYNPILMAARDLIAGGEIGEVRMIRMLSSTVGWDVGDGHWIEDPDEGGAFLDWGVHGMDALSWFTDSRAVRVFASSHNYGGTKPDDISTMAQFEMDSGAMVQVWMSYEFPEPGLGTNMQLTIVGSEAMLDVDRYYLKIGRDDGWTLVTEMEGWNWLEDPKNPRRIATSAGQVQEFSRNILDGTQPSVTGAAARDAVQMIDYARRSAATRQAVEIDARPGS